MTLRAMRCYTPRPMRRTAIVGCLAGVLIAGRIVAEEATPSAPPAVAITQTTTINGTAPELEGRWLVLPAVGVSQGAKRLVPSVWEVTRVDGKMEIHERLVIFPPAQAEALRHGNDEMAGVWEPTKEDLAAINAAWDTLTPEPRGVVEMVHQVTGKDAFDDDLKKDDLSKDALWVVRQKYSFESGGNRPITQANLIAPVKREGDVWVGNYLGLTLAAAPFPIPIKFEGTVRLIPLQRTVPSAWQRISDLFAGCNRR